MRKKKQNPFILDEIMQLSREKQLQIAAELIIEASGYSLKDPNFAGTPDRFARSMSEFLWTKKRIKKELEKVIAVEFPTKYQGMIFSKNIRVYSWCPHHILPIQYNVHIGYIPAKKKAVVIGASKLARVADILSRRMVLQEDYIMDIADVLEKKINPIGIAVVLEGVHDCMKIRGIKQQSATFDMSEMRGAFADNEKTRNEFFHLMAK